MIEVASVTGLATVQDGGRPGHMHEGVPPGGALVPSLLARANAAVSNPPGEAAIELFGGRITLVASAPVQIAADVGRALSLSIGESWTVACGAEPVRYVALRGGIDVPQVLGGRGTLLVAGLGGHEGRALRKGDVLRARAASPSTHVTPLPSLSPEARIRVAPGPDLDRFAPWAFEALLSHVFRISPRRDRMGTRLEGPALPRMDDDSDVSAPMVRGAIQVPSSGEPIVLGPDHPTTGGYPVVATVAWPDLGALEARPVGATVRFAPIVASC